MISLRKVISASLSPNTQADDVFRAIAMMLTPWKWKDGSSIQEAEQWFESRFPGCSAVSFNSGRSALLAILTSFGVGKDDEVLVQSFTCVAVPNSVLWAGAKPVYVDIDKTLNFDVSDAVTKVTSRTRAIIVQHTLGIPADMKKIIAFAQKYHLLIIEDCAHSLGASYNGKTVGTFGDAAFFSFGRDKVVSSVFGGLAIIHKKNTKETEKLITYQRKLPFPKGLWVLQQLLHPFIFAVVLPLYNIGIGKAVLWLSQRLNLLSFPVFPKEKKAERPDEFPKKYSNGLAFLLIRQLQKLESYNVHRRKIAQLYGKTLRGGQRQTVLGASGSIYLRFSILVEDPEKIIAKAKRSGILLGNWYHNIIDPDGVDFDSVYYVHGSCPNAEYNAKHIINLPTNVTESQARVVIDQLL